MNPDDMPDESFARRQAAAAVSLDFVVGCDCPSHEAGVAGPLELNSRLNR